MLYPLSYEGGRPQVSEVSGAFLGSRRPGYALAASPGAAGSAMAQRLTYQPALDGIRAFAVILVVAFHAGFGWMSGGYVGVSVFFTLSGYLITRLLLLEVAQAGRVSVGAFVARRMRRLLPASLVCLVGVVVAARLGAFSAGADVRRDVVGALFQVQNWMQLADGDSYRDLLGAGARTSSPLEHYWSLAVEEQFYWLWPLVVGAAAVVLGPRGRRLGVWGVTMVAAFAAPVVAVRWGPDVAYLATPARLAELLAGAVLAVHVHDRGRRDLPAAARRSRSLRNIAPPQWLALAAAVAIIGVAIMAPSDGGPLYHGAFPVFSLLSVALIAGVATAGPLTWLFERRPVVALGRVSYGVYLFHWPVFVALEPGRIGIDGAALLGLRLVVTAALTVASFLLVERPIRSADWTVTRTSWLAVSGTGLVLVAALVLVPAAATPYWSRTSGVVLPEAPGSATPLPPGSASPPLTERPVAHARTGVGAAGIASPPLTDVERGGSPRAGAEPSPTTPVIDLAEGESLRVLLLGDSTAMSMWPGLLEWQRRHPGEVSVALAAAEGLTVVRQAFGDRDLDEQFIERSATLLDERLPDALQQFVPHVVVVMIGLVDLEDRRWGDAGLLPLTDPAVGESVAADLRALIRTIGGTGAHVALVRSPPMYSYWLDQHDEVRGDSPRRDAYEAIQDLLVAEGPSTSIMELRSYLEATGLVHDRAARPDGMHWSEAAAVEIVDRWMRPELLGLAGIGQRHESRPS